MNKTEEMDFSYILKTIKRWIILIVSFVALGLILALVYNYNAPIKYQSETTLYVQPQVKSNEVDYQGILTNQRMVKTYAQIIKSRKIVDSVIANNKLKLSYQEVIENLTVSSADDTQMIKVAYKDKNKEAAMKITNSFATVFVKQIRESMDITNIKVIDEAIVNDNKVEPRVLVNYLIGLMLGLSAGIVLSFIIESLDNKIKTHEDIKKYLKIKTLGIIPLNSIDKVDKKSKKNYVSPNEINIKVMDNPTSIISESIKMIRTNLDFLDLKLINVTSTLASEGKSEFLTNLAASFVLLDKKVLVVDCDLRKPKIHKNFKIIKKRGLADAVLSNDINIYKDFIEKITISNEKSIDVLTAGSKVSNPSELINSGNFKTLLSQLKKNYDVVLVDCPPVSFLTDGTIVSKIADGTVYVIESNRTDYQIISNCIRELQANKAHLLGAVLTKVNVKREKKLYKYKYDYYYSNYNK